MQAPKNGFFYVLDRATGELISAAPYTEVTWATGIDMKTGRPIETPERALHESRDDQARTLRRPQLAADVVQSRRPASSTFRRWMRRSATPTTRRSSPYRADGISASISRWPPALPAPSRSRPSGFLLAWDPVAQKERWRVPHANMWNGGTLTTAGQSRVPGQRRRPLRRLSRRHRREVWEMAVGSPIIAAPVTYEIDSTQYVAVMAGYGGADARRRAGAADSARPAARVRAWRQGQARAADHDLAAGARADRRARGVTRHADARCASPTRGAVRCATAPRRPQRRAGAGSALLAARHLRSLRSDRPGRRASRTAACRRSSSR